MLNVLFGVRRLAGCKVAAVIWGCASLCGAAYSQQKATPPRTVKPAASCASLEGQRIAAGGIGLPTTGATVSSATLVPAAAERVEGNRIVLAIPEYCKVTGIIAPVDSQAPNINFQANLPTAWNGKIMQFGGSGLNGSIPVALTTGMQWGPESIPPDAPYALSRGFVTYGSDSGHGGGAPGRGAGATAGGRGAPANDWMSNAEALTNFAYAQMKKTHDVAVLLTGSLYGVAPRQSYYMGSSQGGREALMVVQRFPQDYDGVFCQVPVFPQIYWNMLDDALRSQSQVGDAWVPPAKVPLIGKEVLRQCDALDGIADGLVSNYTACNDRFDPAEFPNALAAIRCPGGADTGETCLSDAQIAAVNKVHSAVDFGFPLAYGWTGMPGWPTGGELANNWKVVRGAPTPETPVSGALASLVVRDPSVKLLNFRMANYRERLQELSALLDASNPDISAFRRRGGKLILKVNTTDYTANPRWSYAYYQKVVERLGQASVDQFMRFYVAVGIFHNRNVGTNPLSNEIVPSYVDFIRMLDDWVESGKVPPDAPVLTAMDPVPPFKVNASLPMCRYPLYPRYRGKGDPKQAGSFVCAKRIDGAGYPSLVPWVVFGTVVETSPQNRFYLVHPGALSDGTRALGPSLY